MADRRRAVALAALVAWGALAGAAGATPKEGRPMATGPVAQLAEVGGGGELLITFADAPTRAEAARRLRGLGSLRAAVPEAGIWRLGVARATAGLRARAEGRPEVEAAEWSLERRSDERPPPPVAPGPAPEVADPLLVNGNLWWLTPRGNLSWSPALTATGPRPRIAILDSGVDPLHEEWGGPQSPLVAPRNAIVGNAEASDWGFTGHGTHVAGIAAAPINGVGIVGVAPASRQGAQVIPVRIADPTGRASDGAMIVGIRWAVRHGARIINISAGGEGASHAFREAILWATDRGALVVASVGNDGDGPTPTLVNYPAGYPRVLGVAAQCGPRVSSACRTPMGVADFSNRNRSVDVIAPGVDIVSSVPTRVSEGAVAHGYATKDGTSMAAPYASGVAALVQAANGNALSPFQLTALLRGTARDVAPRGRDVRSGDGAVDALAATTTRAPVDDVDEVNDDIRWLSPPREPGPGATRVVRAHIDRYDDPDDVYPVRLRRGERLTVRLQHTSGRKDLYVWGPGTRTVATDAATAARHLMVFRPGGGRTVRAVWVARRSGIHYVNVYARRGGGDYALALSRSAAR